MRGVAILYGLAYVQLAVFAIVSASLARAVGVNVLTISLGTPGIVPLRRGRPRIVIGPVPTGSVEMLGLGAPDDSIGSWSQRRLGARLLVILGPWIAIAMLAMVLLGPAHAARSIAHGFAQMLFVLDLTPLVRRMVDLASTTPPGALGILCAKAVAFNLLPFGGLAGGAVVRELATQRGRVPGLVERWLVGTLTLIALWTIVRFGFALIQVLRDGGV